MLSLAQKLTLSDFEQMYQIERAYYDPYYITPPQEAFGWYQAYPLSTLAVKDGAAVAGFLNLFPVRQGIFDRILAGTYNDREMGLGDLADPFSGSGTLHMFLCCIARHPAYAGQGVGELLLQAGVEAYRPVSRRCGSIITDNVTEAGRRFSQRHGFALQRESNHGSFIYMQPYEAFVQRVEAMTGPGRGWRGGGKA